MTQTQSTSITEYRNQIQTEVMSNKEVFNALAQNTFKGLQPENIPKALLEGMMRGYSIKDFMVKKIYATPFWNYKAQKQEYALVQSIADVRATAMKAGQSGKSAPSFTEVLEEYKDSKTNEVVGTRKLIDSCSVTVWKQGGDDRGFTATVFFSEYEKPPTKTKDGKEIPGMWQTKPRTMISKVAEMHALRMAFPEVLADAYIEEEFDKDNLDPKVVIDKDAQVIDEEGKKSAIEVINGETNLVELQDFFKSLPSHLVKNDEVYEAYKLKKEALTPKPATKVAKTK